MNNIPEFCPYQGLQPFDKKNSEYFFGRVSDRERIISNLRVAPLTVLYGASGVGKTSVLQAGVVAELEKAPRTVVASFLTWQKPDLLSALKDTILQALPPSSGDSKIPIDPALPFDDFLVAVSRRVRGDVLIILDQFEEYFLYAPSTEVDDGFEAQFASAVNRDEVRANFLLSMREDALSKLDRFKGRIRNILGNTLRISHLDAAAAEDAIREPLRVYNDKFAAQFGKVTIEDQAVQSILTQLQTAEVEADESDAVGRLESAGRRNQIETPFLQLIMTELWSVEMKQNSRVLRCDTFEKKLGGAKAIVRDYVNTALNISAEDQEVCARVFRFLVTPDQSKIALPVSVLASWAELPPARLSGVLTELARGENRILRAVEPSAGQHGEVRYELFHDVLAPAVLDWRKHYVQEQEVRQARKQAAKEAAKAEKRAAKAARDRKMYWLVAALIVACALSAWLGVLYYLNFRQQARVSDSLRFASEAREKYLSNPNLGISLALKAIYVTLNKDRMVLPQAQSALELVTQYSLPASGLDSTVSLSEDGKHVAIVNSDGSVDVKESIFQPPEQAIIVSLHTAEGDYYAKNTQTMTLTKGDYYVKNTYTTTPSNPKPPNTPLCRLPDSATWAPSPQLQAVTLWQATGVRPTVTLLGAHVSPTLAPAFSRDGKYLAFTSAGQEKDVIVWKIDSGSVCSRVTLPGFNGKVSAFAFSSPERDLLATGSVDGTVKLWDARAGHELPTRMVHEGPVLAVALSPEGRRVAASVGRNVRLWEVDTGKDPRMLEGQHGLVVRMAFSPDAKLLVTAALDNSIEVWDTESGISLKTLQIDPGYPAVTFSGDGRWLAVASSASIGLPNPTFVQVWNVENWDSVYHSPASKDPIVAIKMNESGSQFVTVAANGVLNIHAIRLDEEIKRAGKRGVKEFSPQECKELVHVKDCNDFYTDEKFSCAWTETENCPLLQKLGFLLRQM